MTERGLVKELIGTVISDRMQKTIVVQAFRRVAHKKYKKVLTLKKKFYAHDEKETAGMGDVVRIRESRPLSKTKRWTLVNVVRAAKIAGEDNRLEKSRGKSAESSEVGGSSDSTTN